MGCSNNEHVWTARFYEGGSLAFWFCSRCGEIDRDAGILSESLESTKNPSGVVFPGKEPPISDRKWGLTDGSVLIEGNPCSVSFRGTDIPTISRAHEYDLTDTDGAVIREYRAFRERVSSNEESFILTRFQVEGNHLIKYRIRCIEKNNPNEADVGECSSIAIIFNLKPVEV
ncbi:MAG: hypothetical protein K8S62_11145 [Candidatus Sabulitectum sp.]|nr:hypothetical protein [Candidatus Sabulitectum sp.]